MFDAAKSRGFEVLAVHHAEAILTHDMPDAISDLEGVIPDMRIAEENLWGGGGGGGGAFTQRTRRSLVEAGWGKNRFEIQTTVDGEARESVSHEVDHVK